MKLDLPAPVAPKTIIEISLHLAFDVSFVEFKLTFSVYLNYKIKDLLSNFLTQILLDKVFYLFLNYLELYYFPILDFLIFINVFLNFLLIFLKLFNILLNLIL